MKKIFSYYFKPSPDELANLWSECIFAVDANVVLNLYRYSATTKNELQKSLDAISERIFIPHQAAKEFLRNRLIVTATQAEEYTLATKVINDLIQKIKSKDRHPFLPDEEVEKFDSYTENLKELLSSSRDELLNKFHSDEILEYVQNLFDNKTGSPYTIEQLQELARDGEIRYKKEIPPGYKDSKKEDVSDEFRKYGDLILWNQLIQESLVKGRPIIFITDDKKADWWLEQSGRTIGPRIELIEEFQSKTKNAFWMYTVERFVQESASVSNTEVDVGVLRELLKYRYLNDFEVPEWNEIELEDDEWDPSINEYYPHQVSPVSAIHTSQLIEGHSALESIGELTITINRELKYATGTGKFNPRLSDVPDLIIEPLSCPENISFDMVKISHGCGTNRDFNIHLRAKNGRLSCGTYTFRYSAIVRVSETK